MLQNQVGQALAVLGGAAEQLFAGASAFEVQMRVVFPGKADPAVQLNRLGGAVHEGFAGVDLGDGAGFAQLTGDRPVASGIEHLTRHARRVITG